ncbi:hypothetical protein PLICRDRAFT_37257 [Plicaturopsis crispa FD-325 SS-3]|nr:hypothetical protein PLICRDRAFT_37257 [Plicaturopsis crispa FD-325 SS-3]
MARIRDADSDEEEIGRGRRAQDSSSSRESSPSKKQKRSFTPTSDDGDLVVPPVIDDDTPPPENAPIIRQAVAFGSAFSHPVPVNTYQDTQLSTPQAFLPGQKPATLPPPPPPKTKSASQSKRRRNGRTKHFDDQFSDQTGSFRLGTYYDTHLPAPAPPATSRQNGAGPYRSAFRATETPTFSFPSTIPAPAPPLPPALSDPVVAYNPMFGFQATSSPGPSSTLSNTPLYSQNGPQAPPQPQQGSAAKKTSTTKPRGEKKTRGAAQAPKQKRSGRADKDTTERPDASGSGTTSSTAGTSYYRTNYEHQAEAETQANSASEPPAPSSSQNAGSGNKPPRPTRMVTLLIEDQRSGVIDSQLAEIRVPLRAADNKEDGFWADAKEIVEQLQAGPFRIDGPAKAYTMRGKYRQFFLRLSETNEVDCISANLSVSQERTIDVIVEAPHPPGTIPPPPQIPLDLLPPEEAERLQEIEKARERERMEAEERARDFSIVSPEARRLMRPYDYGAVKSDMRQLQREEGSHPPSHRRSSSSSSRYTPPAWPSQPTQRDSQGPTSPGQNAPGPEPSSGASPSRSTESLRHRGTSPHAYSSDEEDEEEIDKAIIQYLKPFIEEDRGWTRYMESRAKPQRVTEVLVQYEFVQEKLDRLVGMSTPPHWPGAPAKSVRRDHVLGVLNLPEQWGDECTEMLSLLRLYGPGGVREHNPTVVEQVESIEMPQGKPAKRCLRLLREIDKDWRDSHPNDPSYEIALAKLEKEKKKALAAAAAAGKP